MKDEVKVFDALKAREVLKRVNKFLGILIRESLVNDAQLLKDGEIENESDLADDVWEVLQGVTRNCDVGTPLEQYKRFDKICSAKVPVKDCPLFEKTSPCCSPLCFARWAQMPYEDVNV